MAVAISDAVMIPNNPDIFKANLKQIEEELMKKGFLKRDPLRVIDLYEKTRHV